MNRNLGCCLLIVLLTYGCKDKSPTEPSVSGQFVVDSFTATSVAGTNPTTSQYSSNLTCTLNYHFKNLPGTINSPSFIVAGDTVNSTRQISYYNSQKVDTPLTDVQSVWLSKHISAQDGLYAHFIVWASYWTRINKDSIQYYGDFNWKDSVKILVQN